MKQYLASVLNQLRAVLARRVEGNQSDADLETAFEVLIWRHGPMVLRVGQRVLRNAADAEEVVQATFLALVRQAGSIRRGTSLVGWLYRVAFRISVRARMQREKRLTATALEELPAPLSEDDRSLSEGGHILDEELQRLPEKYRVVLVLAYFEGLTNQEIATQLSFPLGTVCTRLARGREMLRKRLVRRGVTSSAGGLGALLAAATPTEPLRAGLVQAAIKATRVLWARQGAEAGILSPKVIALAEGACKMMWLTRVSVVGAVLISCAIASSTAGLLAWRKTAGGQEAVAAAEPPATSPQAPRAESRGATDGKATPSGTAVGAKPREKQARQEPAAEVPRIVHVEPANGAKDVDPVTEIRIRFDRPMDPASVFFEWTLGGGAGFRPRAEMRYAAANHEFILPVALKQGALHEIQINREEHAARSENKRYVGFRSATGITARPYRWSFHTGTPAAKKGPKPRLTDVEFFFTPEYSNSVTSDPGKFKFGGFYPAFNLAVALLTQFKLTFDQPMDATSGEVQSDNQGTPGPRLIPTLLGLPDYNAERRQFTLLVRLPPNWNGEVRLARFRSKDGVEAEPFRQPLRTLRNILSPRDAMQIDQARKSSVLRQLIDKARQARRALTSIREDISWTTAYGPQEWCSAYQIQPARFELHGRKFVGMIDDIMEIPFRIGSDGTTCWLRRQDEVLAIPSKDIKDKSLLFCDPFDAFSSADAGAIIRRENLEYGGETVLHGRRCHRVRSWAVHFFGPDWLAPVRDWYLDAATLLPVRLNLLDTGARWLDFAYSRVNQPLDEAIFRPETGPALKAIPMQALPEGYTSRFLIVNDGSTGRMSVRWGMKGPKGTSSSGLN